MIMPHLIHTTPLNCLYCVPRRVPLTSVTNFIAGRNFKYRTRYQSNQANLNQIEMSINTITAFLDTAYLYLRVCRLGPSFYRSTLERLVCDRFNQQHVISHCLYGTSEVVNCLLLLLDMQLVLPYIRNALMIVGL